MSPLYISIEDEPSSTGKGSVDLILFVPCESYNPGVFTDVHIRLKNTENKNIFSKAYRDAVLSAIDKLKQAESVRNEIRVAALRQDIKDKSKEAENRLNEAEKNIEEAKAELEANKAKYENEYTAYTEAKTAFETDLADRKSNLEKQRPYIDEATYRRLSSELAAYKEAAVRQFDDAEKELNEAKEQLDNATERLNEEIRLFNEKKAEFKKELEDALDSIPSPEWYYLTLSGNISYMSFKGNAEKVKALSKVFPVFFFFVASLVALTSITRLVEEQRSVTGTLKSLGYSDFSIMSYYILFSLVASLLGSITGVFSGSKILPSVIINAYGIMYLMPEIQTKIWISKALLFSSAITLCVTLSAFIACIDQLREKPASLMIAKAPKPGKRVFLEKITFLWDRMTFSQKVTARNLIRYKKRFFMSIIGVVGCTALLLTGFGIKDSISDIVSKQFGEIYKYDIGVTLKNETDIENIGYMTDSLYIHTEAVNVSKGDESAEATLYVPKNRDKLPDFITLRNRKTGKAIDFDENAVILTEKMCETLNIKIGDKVSISDRNNRVKEYTVSGITENYITSFVYMPAEQYGFTGTPDYRTVLVKINEYSKEIKDEITKELLQKGNVAQVQFSQSIRESFAKTIQSIDYIVTVIIGFAGALAIIVLYNLTNINISERIKELATLKVLGFHENETALYIFRETTVLSLIGSLLGLFLGIYLHAFVVKTAEVDMVMFGRTIYAKSYILAFIVTMLFSVLVDFIMLKRIRSINMVESLKAPE